jgi:hypothetical protein
MRFLTISGPGVAQDEDFCPNCHVIMDERDGYKVCLPSPGLGQRSPVPVTIGAGAQAVPSHSQIPLSVAR